MTSTPSRGPHFPNSKVEATCPQSAATYRRVLKAASNCRTCRGRQRQLERSSQEPSTPPSQSSPARMRAAGQPCEPETRSARQKKTISDTSRPALGRLPKPGTCRARLIAPDQERRTRGYDSVRPFWPHRLVCAIGLVHPATGGVSADPFKVRSRSSGVTVQFPSRQRVSRSSDRAGARTVPASDSRRLRAASVRFSDSRTRSAVSACQAWAQRPAQSASSAFLVSFVSRATCC